MSRRQVLAGRPGSLTDQAGEVEGQREGIADQGSLGGVGQAEPGRALEAAAGLAGVAGFGIALATDAQLPGGRTDRQVPRQADTAIGQAEAGGEAEAQGVVWVDKLAGQAG